MPRARITVDRSLQPDRNVGKLFSLSRWGPQPEGHHCFTRPSPHGLAPGTPSQSPQIEEGQGQDRCDGPAKPGTWAVGQAPPFPQSRVTLSKSLNISEVFV